MRLLLWSITFGLEVATVVVVCIAVRAHLTGAVQAVDIRLTGPPTPPHLEFACELDTPRLQSLFAKQDLIENLQKLRAGVTLSLVDLGPGRADIVSKLNEARIPVTAWLALPKEQGYYLNASNATQAGARFTEFEQWTKANHLRWARIGLDIEPNLFDFEAVRRGDWWHPLKAVVGRCLDRGSVARSRNAYSALIRRMQTSGYQVDTYQFPFIADERKVHSNVLERLFGIVDVRGNREAFMTYTSFNHTIDSALIWAYGPDAQVIVVGSTAGDPTASEKFRPLNWDEFTRDLIVASNFSTTIGVYSLEGCVRQGFLPRLTGMNWGDPVTIPADANGKIAQLRMRIQGALWTASRLLYIVVAIVLVDILFVVWWRYRGWRSHRLTQDGRAL